MRIRQATDQDAPACAAIYSPYVSDTVISFEETPPTAQDFAGRIASAIQWLVAEVDGTPIGYAYATRHRDRAAYRFACDVSVYLAPHAHGQGIGTALYVRLLGDLEERGFRMACAGVTQPNPASMALHVRMGFEPVGSFRDIGWKFGSWHDVTWLQRRLGEPGPAVGEPRP